MKKKLFRTHAFITGIVLIGFICITIINYCTYSVVIRDDIRNISRLTSLNIFSSISNELTKPIFVSLTMANDSFLKSWLRGENDSPEQIAELQDYLNGLKKKYDYSSVFLVAVHFEARKLGLKGLSPEHIPAAGKVLRERGHLFIPLIVLLWLMFDGYTPLFAAAASIFATVGATWLPSLIGLLRTKTARTFAFVLLLAVLGGLALSGLLSLGAAILTALCVLASAWCSARYRMTPRVVVQALDEGARGAVGVGAACVIIGIIIGTVSLTGLGLTFGYEVLKYVGEGQLYLGGLFVMIMSTILGMGVPGVAAYVIVAAVAVPVLTGVGVMPMAAHMFCLFYACLSNITPPVAMSSYVAAGIAHSDQTRTSLIAVKLGLTGFILPFFFLNNPLLLYSSANPALATLWAFATACLGVSALAAGLQGWLFGPCNSVMRGLLLVAAFLAIDPGLKTDLAALALCAVAGVWSWKERGKG